MVEQVEFYSDGTLLRGALYLPEGEVAGGFPAVAFCHGFGATIEYVAGDFAEALSARGVAMLIFDHRGFGHSEGEKWKLDPNLHVEDIVAAVLYLSTRSEIDRKRLGLFGISLGGATGIVAAAVEPMIKCLVSCVPFADWNAAERDRRRYEDWLEFHRILEDDRVQAVLTGVSRRVDPDEILTRDAESVRWNEYLKKNWSSRVAYDLPLSAGRAMMRFRPIDHVSKVSNVMFVGAAKDTLTAPEQLTALYDAAIEPKRLFMLEDATHHEIYAGPCFDRIIEAATSWYAQRL